MDNTRHNGAPRRRIGLAVSGGADSVALLALMAGLQASHGFDAVVLHVDHGLRPDSADDARFVESLAASYGLPFHALRTRVRRRRGESLEMAARRVRLAFFARMTTILGLDAIATGHHADDVAETFLLRLARGSGPEGLAGLKPVSHVDGVTFIRPLLNVRDADLRRFLSEHPPRRPASGTQGPGLRGGPGPPGPPGPPGKTGVETGNWRGHWLCPQAGGNRTASCGLRAGSQGPRGPHARAAHLAGGRPYRPRGPRRTQPQASRRLRHRKGAARSPRLAPHPRGRRHRRSPLDPRLPRGRVGRRHLPKLPLLALHPRHKLTHVLQRGRGAACCDRMERRHLGGTSARCRRH